MNLLARVGSTVSGTDIGAVRVVAVILLGIGTLRWFTQHVGYFGRISSFTSALERGAIVSDIGWILSNIQQHHHTPEDAGELGEGSQSLRLSGLQRDL